jgi:predicted nucleic acid-binding protein
MGGGTVTVGEAIAGVSRLFLDTAPVIYHVQSNPAYRSRTRAVFQRLSEGAFEAVASAITLAECLVHPLRAGDADLAGQFRNTITRGANTLYVGVDAVVERAAGIRARYGLRLLDSLQLAAALASGCDAFLTNDHGLRRVEQIRVIVLDDLEP